MKKQFISFAKNPVLPMVFSLAVFCAWIPRQVNDIKKAEWLLGTWENKTPRGSVYETWEKVNEAEFAGKSFMVKEKDTLVFETIRLVQEEGGLFYIPVVKNQNQGLPVRFQAKEIAEGTLVFENQGHDFPQVISYTKTGADSLTAEISGTRNGQERRQMFQMKKIK